MKKKIFLIINIFILTSCFWGGEDDTSVLTEKLYQNKEFLFSMTVPATFIKLPEEQLPKDVIVSYLDILMKEDSFTPNLSLMLEPKEYKDMDILIFAIGYIEKTKKILKDYELIYIDNIDIFGKKTKYHIFKASKDGKKYKFIQTFFEANSDNIIVFTAILNENTGADQDEKYLNIIRSIKKI